MKIELTPSEIHALINSTNKVIHLLHNSPNTAQLLGIDAKTQKHIKQTLDKIKDQCNQQIRLSPINKI